jgi:Mn-dependent DtxR family transcriptional regulator
VSELGGVIRASKAVEMFQRLAVKNGAVVREKTEVLDVTKQGELAIIRLQHRHLRKFIFFFLNVKKKTYGVLILLLTPLPTSQLTGPS